MEVKKKHGTVISRLFQSRELSLAVILLVVCGIFTLFNPAFLSGDNLLNILRQITLVTILAVGQTFVITSGGIDLSVGYNMALSSIVMAVALKAGLPTGLCICICITLGTFIGVINGLMITKLRLQPFIATLGMAKVASGMILVITEGFIISLKDEVIITLGQGSIGPVPIMVLFLPVVVIVGAFLMNRTVFGNRVKAIGGNETATALSGINVHRMKIIIYGLAGMFCGIAGVIITGRLNGGNPNAGQNFDMDTVAAVIVGGTAMSGGSGTILGTLLGAMLLGALKNGLILLGIDMYWQTVFVGVIIVAVCALDSTDVLRKK